MVKKIISIILLIILISTPLFVQGAGQNNGAGVTEGDSQQLTSPIIKPMYSEKADLKYLITLPKDYNEKSTVKRPLIVFLHGSGERGNDLEKVKVHGIPTVYDKVEDFPFITISPQCTEDTWWNSLTGSLNILIDETIRDYNIDADRVYLTGLSMGGYGTWEMAMCYPEKFAAIAPICGAGDPYDIKYIKDIPVWAFHGQKDTSVPIAGEQALVDALKACGGNVNFTIYPDGGHNVWTETYNNPELYKWLLKQKRSSNAASLKREEFTPEIVNLAPMKVAYVRIFGKDCKTRAFDQITKFVSEKQLSDVKYFGFNIDGDISGGNPGFEAWATVSEDVQATDDVKIKDVSSGLYAAYSAGNETGNISRTWQKLYQWLRPSEYRYGIDNEMEELKFADDKVSIKNIELYLPIISRNDTRKKIIDSISKGYSEKGSWRTYGYIRTSASTGNKADSAQWTPEIKEPGYYKVSILRPSNSKSDPKAKVEIASADGNDTQFVDFTTGIVEWFELGIYKFNEGKNGFISVSANSPDSFVRASSVKLEYVSEDAIKELSDIKGHWAEQNIKELIYKGIINGNEDGTFMPDDTVAIDAFLKMVVTALGYKLENGHQYWASTYIDKAKELGLIGDEFSDYSAPITRLQMVQILVNATKEDVNVENSTKSISDLDTISADKQEVVLKALGLGLIKGNEDNTFKAYNNMTRAEGAAVILRLIKPGKRIYTEVEQTKETQVNMEDGSIVLPASKANIDNTKVIRIKDNGHMGYWSADEAASWDIDVKKAGKYIVEITYAIPDEFIGTDINIELNGESKTVVNDKGTGSWDNLKTMQLGTFELPEGKTKLVMKHGKIVSGAFLDLSQVKLIPTN